MIPFYAAFKAILYFVRKCPQCGREQVVKPSQRFDAVPCKFCKAIIPSLIKKKKGHD